MTLPAYLLIAFNFGALIELYLTAEILQARQKPLGVIGHITLVVLCLLWPFGMFLYMVSRIVIIVRSNRG